MDNKNKDKQTNTQQKATKSWESLRVFKTLENIYDSIYGTLQIYVVVIRYKFTFHCKLPLSLYVTNLRYIANFTL